MKFGGLVIVLALVMSACAGATATPVPPATPTAVPTPTTPSASPATPTAATATATPTPVPTGTPTTTPTPVPTGTPTATPAPTPESTFRSVRDCTEYSYGGVPYWFIGEEVVGDERLRKFTTARPDYCPALAATPAPAATPTPMPVQAVPVELKPDGELIIHGRGDALFALRLTAAQHRFDFGIWDAAGAERSMHVAEVTFGPTTVFSGRERDQYRSRRHNVDASWLEWGDTQVSIKAGPDDQWFFFIAGPNDIPLEMVLMPDALPYTPTPWMSYVDGGRDLALLFEDYPDAVKHIRALPWAFDGLGPMPSPKHEAAYRLSAARQNSETLFDQLMAMEWVRDAEITFWEAWAIGSVTRVGPRWPGGVEHLLGMPFLDTLETMDALALGALASLEGESRLEAVLAHPALAGGVTDEVTDIIAMMGRPFIQRAGYELEMLELDRVVTLRRTVDLPLQDGVPFSVIWPGGTGTVAEAERTMSVLIDVVTRFELLMDIPYPQPYVVVMVSDLTSYGRGGGDGIIILAPEYHGNRNILPQVLAHTYWPFWPSWVSGGGATFMDLYYQSALTGRPLPPPRECDGFDNIRQLEEADLYAHRCNSDLGSALFVELYGAMGHDPFREAFGRLYTWMDDDALFARCGRLEGKAECYVRAAFVEYMPDYAAVTEEIINRRFHGVP